MTRKIHAHKKVFLFLSAALLLTAWLLHLADLDVIRQGALLTSTAAASIPIVSRALQAARMKLPSIELLVTIAVIGALAIGEYLESAVVTFLFLLGEYLEFRSLAKTRSALQELTDLTPLEARVIRSGDILTVPAEDIRLGEHVIVRSGEAVPADGKIVSGQAELIEAALTGESIPAFKKIGDLVYSGTLVDHGYLEVTAQQVGADTRFARMIELVEEAQESKSRAAKLLDRFAKVYTPAAVGLSILVYAWTHDPHMAVTFLVVACPGALVIGAPASGVAGIGSGARRGVLIKGGDAMDRLARTDTFVFDKTGTLTEGNPKVTDIKTFDFLNIRELLRLAACAETASEHHLGRAIVREALSQGITDLTIPADVRIFKGSGLRAVVDGRSLTVGSRERMRADRIVLSESVLRHADMREREGHTIAFAAVDGRLAGLFAIADPIRADAPEALERLRRSGIKTLIMLTGDNRHTAKRVADQLGLDEYHAELMPEDKAAFIENLKARGRSVAMAGDGINDAPSIAAANIGVAMGGGTGTALETAEIVLLADRLASLPFAYSLARATVRNIRQNLWIAVGTVLLLLIGILAGSVHLASGMLIHEASVLLVILNAARLARYGHRDNRAAQGVQWKPTEIAKEV